MRKQPAQPPRGTDLASIAAAISALSSDVFHHLDGLARQVHEFSLVDALNDGRLTDEDFNLVERFATRMIGAVDVVTGAGMAAAPSGSDGAGLMHWWVSVDGKVVAKRHVLNPRSDSYYDFSHSRWFQQPARHGSATLIAPYVDSWGTDDLTITAAVPTFLDEHGVTVVVAADLNARDYIQAAEQLLLPISPAILVDSEGRAVASTVPEIETGVRLEALGTWITTQRAEVTGLQWDVALLDNQSEDNT